MAHIKISVGTTVVTVFLLSLGLCHVLLCGWQQ